MQPGFDYQRLLADGVTHWNEWRKRHPGHRPMLEGLDLTQSFLFGINLADSDLREADLTRACLIGADLSRADLRGANLEGAYLNEASLREADLGDANLTDAQVMKVDLLGANLAGTCLDSSRQAEGSISIFIEQVVERETELRSRSKQTKPLTVGTGRPLAAPLVLGPVSTATRVARV